MVNRLTIAIWIFSLAMGSWINPAWAGQGGGGSIVGNGGGSVACFKNIDARNVENGIITDHGWVRLTTAVTLEYYIGSATNQIDPRLRQFIVDLDTFSTSSFLWERVHADPDFSERLNSAAQNLLFVPQPLEKIMDPYLPDTHDWLSPVPFPINCSRVQAAVRYGSIVNFEPSIWAKLSGPQQVLLTFHENIYYAGDLKSGMSTSVPTQTLLTYLLSPGFTPQGFKALVQRLRF